MRLTHTLGDTVDPLCGSTFANVIITQITAPCGRQRHVAEGATVEFLTGTFPAELEQGATCILSSAHIVNTCPSHCPALRFPHLCVSVGDFTVWNYPPG